MGFIAQLASGNKATFSGQNAARRLWDRTFGQTKEGDESRFPRVRRTPGAPGGGAWGRSVTSSTAAQVRLIQAMRSMAPGGWSDDRWEQQRHFTDVRYFSLHRIGEQLLQSEFEVFHQVGPGKDDKKPVMPDDPPIGDRHVNPYRLVELLKRPNNDDTFGELMYFAGQQLGLDGMSLFWMLPNEMGTPMELFPIPTAVAIPQPAINPDYPDGYYRIQPVYPYGPFSSYPTPSTSVGASIDARWMIRVKYTHPLLRYDGWSPQTALRLMLDTIQQMDESRWHTLKRVVDPSAVLSTDDAEGMQGFPEEEIERMLAEIENEKQGTSNVGKLFVPPPGWKLEPWNSNLRDLQYTEGWDQLVSFAMAAFGISKEAAGMIGSTAYAQLFASLKQLHWNTLTPLCYRIAAKFTQRLCPFFGDNLIIEIKPPKIDDHEIVFNKIQTGQAAVVLTKNQVLKMLDLPVTQEEWGNDMAGDPSPKMQEQMQQEQAQQQQEVQMQQDGEEAGREHEVAMQEGEHEHQQQAAEEEREYQKVQEMEAREHEAAMQEGGFDNEREMKEADQAYEEVQEEEAREHEMALKEGEMEQEQEMAEGDREHAKEMADGEMDQERELREGDREQEMEMAEGDREHQAKMKAGDRQHQQTMKAGDRANQREMKAGDRAHQSRMKKGDQRHQRVMKKTELTHQDRNAMQDRQLERERPKPGQLNRGSLGPRMKSITELAREGIRGEEETEVESTPKKPTVGKVQYKTLRDKYKRKELTNGRH